MAVWVILNAILKSEMEIRANRRTARSVWLATRQSEEPIEPRA